MRKEIVVPLGAAALGVGGFFLRRWELATAFEPETGLSVWGLPASWCLLALSAVAVLVALLVSLPLRKQTPLGYDETFYAPFGGYFGAMIASALLMAATGVFGVYQYASRGEPAILRLVLSLLCLFGGASLFVLGQNNYRGLRQGKMSLYVLAPAYTACLWLITSYMRHAEDPVVMDYAYGLVGVVAAVLACYFVAGFAYQRGKAVWCTLFSFLGIYFGVVSMAGADWFFILLCASLLLYQLANVTVLLYRAGRPAVFETEVITDEG